MQGAQGHQIYPMAEQSGEFVSEFLDLPAQSPSRAQCVQNIDIAVRPGGPARLRAEDLELGDSVPVADVGPLCRSSTSTPGIITMVSG